MTFIHTADIHIGMIPDSDKPWGFDRAYDIRETFSNLIKKCKDTNCNLLLIAGDLWNQQPLTSDLNEINELFKTIPNTHIVIIAGEADKIRDNASVVSYVFEKNVHYILSNYPSKIEIQDLNLVIHGFSYHDSEINKSLIDTIENPTNDKKVHILIAHGGDASHCPIDFTILANKNFSYCALGHIHKHQEIIKQKIVYCGSLEPLSSSETGQHGVYIGNINTVTGKIESLNFEPMSNTQYLTLKIKIQEDTTNEELVKSITKEIEQRGFNNIYKLHIIGFRNPDINIDLNILEKSFKIVDIFDETEPRYDFMLLSKEHPNDMIGAYIRSFGNEKLDDMIYVRRKALFYGIDALLKTTDNKN